MKFLIPNIAMLLLYPVGVPAYFLIILVRAKTSFRTPETRAELGFLYDGYATDTWWFELVDMAHKLCLTSLLGFFPTDLQLPGESMIRAPSNPSQCVTTVGMCITCLYTVIILVRKPYYRKGDDRLHLFAQV